MVGVIFKGYKVQHLECAINNLDAERKEHEQGPEGFEGTAYETQEGARVPYA